jgi:hypothetical protein
MSLRSHPLALLRPALSQKGVSGTAVLKDSKNGDIFTLSA